MTVESAPPKAQLPDRHRLADDIRESLPVRLLRAARWITRFGYWCRSLIAAAAKAVQGWLSDRIIGAQPPQDVTCDPAYYGQLLDGPWPLDRPALTRFEKASPTEAGAIARVARIVASSVVKGYCRAKPTDSAAKATRAQHAKHHGCLQANFIVHPNLPARYAVGVFKPGANYPAVVRFSNAMGSRQRDKNVDGRGMAVKLRNVSGASFLSSKVPQLGTTEQDFLISGHPVFFCRGVDDYTAFMAMLDMPGNTRLEQIRGALAFARFFLSRPPRVLWAFIVTAIRPVTSPVEMVYHSMTPFLFGPDTVVRYVVTPLAKKARPRRKHESLGDDYLHDELVAALNPARRPNGSPIAMDFSIQIRHTPKPADVEDACKRWRKRRDVKVSLGRIEIPMQRFDVANQECACEDVSFNPWNCLPEHRPLGSLNRMRLAVYMASTQVRHRLNGL